jgi:hypothetical protein
MKRKRRLMTPTHNLTTRPMNQQADTDPIR